MPDPIPLLRRAGAAFLLLLAAAAPRALPAAEVGDVLPVDQVFMPSAKADATGIAVRWTITPGYYLYRHRTSVSADAGFAAGALQMPKGDAHVDKFFGPVETYHRQLVAHLPGTPRAAQTVLTVRYQGCADAGVCYPPQTRRLIVQLRAFASTDASTAPAANTEPRDPFARAVGPAAGDDPAALPLPAARAFGFEAIAGDGNSILLRFTPAPGYYLYRDRTRLRLDPRSLAAGFTLGQPAWPAARPHHDDHFGNVQVYFDQVDVPLPVQRRRAEAATVHLVAVLQGCQTDGICYPPMTRTVDVDLPRGRVGALPAAASVTPAQGAVAEARQLAREAAAAADAVVTNNPSLVSGQAPGATGDPITRSNPPEQPDPTALAAFDPAQSPPQARLPAAGGALSALLLALLGGLVLNLMPCVLPVLSLKALSLAESGSPAAARRHALWYTAGVVLSFLVLGGAALVLRQTGQALGWGFQLQQPLVVASLALVMFALGLGLSGLWHAGGRWVGAGHSLATRGGAAGDFFTGVLAVIVATPCTAPFMGAALAWAFVAPTVLALAVFAALGLGLALPFIVIGLVPALATWLPRPGAWMETLKQALAFPLYLTAAWLLWVLGKQRGTDAIAWTLVAAVAVAFAAWAWGRARHGRRRWAAVAVLVAGVSLLYALSIVGHLPRPGAAVVSAGDARQPFSLARLAALRAEHRVVFVNVTADWCVTCKANEKTVLGTDAFQREMHQADAAYLLGDWTNVDPVLTRFLQSHGAVGVPLYVVYPRQGPPHVLPTVLTPDLMRDALAAAAR